MPELPLRQQHIGQCSRGESKQKSSVIHSAPFSLGCGVWRNGRCEDTGFSFWCASKEINSSSDKALDL